MRADDKRCLLVEVSGFDNSFLPVVDKSLFAQWIIYLLQQGYAITQADLEI